MSSTYNPRSNRLAESAVKNIKHLIHKCTDCKEDLDLAISEFRNCLRVDGYSPAQRLFGRRQRGLLPALPAALAPVDREAADRAKDDALVNMKTRHDARASKTPLTELAVGDNVRCQHPVTKKWDVRGEVVSVRDNHRSYVIMTDDGREALRNRRYLRPIFCADMSADLLQEENVMHQDSCSVRDQDVIDSDSSKRKSNTSSCTEHGVYRGNTEASVDEKLPRCSSRLAAKAKV